MHTVIVRFRGLRYFPIIAMLLIVLSTAVFGLAGAVMSGVIVGVAPMMLAVCPRCKKSPYIRKTGFGAVGFFWPESKCSKCD